MKVRLVFVFTLMFLVAGMWVSGVSAESQTWYFTREDHPGPDAIDGGDFQHAINKIMTNSTPDGPDQTVSIAELTNKYRVAWWYSDVTAYADVDFGNAEWTASVCYRNPSYAGTLRMEVFEVNGSDGTLVGPLVAGSLHMNDKTTTDTLWNATLTKAAPDVLVRQGNYLAVRLMYVSDRNSGSDTMIIRYNAGGDGCGNSWLSSGYTDPGFPTPEFPTIALMGLGLLGLAGLVFSNRRRLDVAA